MFAYPCVRRVPTAQALPRAVPCPPAPREQPDHSAGYAMAADLGAGAAAPAEGEGPPPAVACGAGGDAAAQALEILASMGRAKSAEMEALEERKNQLKRERDQVQANVRRTKKREANLMNRASNTLSAAQLMEVAGRKAAIEAKAKAKAKAKGKAKAKAKAKAEAAAGGGGEDDDR